MLSDDERQRILDALNFDPDAVNIVSLVARLQNVEELHQFILNYNCNDGLLPLWSIAKNPKCDLGTALTMYWLLSDVVLSPGAFEEKADPNRNDVGLAAEIQKRRPVTL